LIAKTIRGEPDEAWRALRACVSEPNALLAAGWDVVELACTEVRK
jgi:hypothetical protein